jgi:uncharacterized protein YuzE
MSMRMVYFEQEDILQLMVAPGPEARSVGFSPDVTVEMDVKGQILGIEILNASRFMRDSIMDSIQSQMLRHLEMTPA